MATTQTSSDASSAANPASLWVVLALAGIGSVGTGAVTNGIGFITTHGLGYQRLGNLAITGTFGAAYVAGAALAGPGLRALAARFDAITTRSVLVTILLIMTAACPLPTLAQQGIFPISTEMAVWALVPIYAALTGVLWPVVESYLSGGRREGKLRKAIGRFNIVWSGSVALSYWMMAPLIERGAIGILAMLGALHLVMGALVFAFPKEPPRHLSEDHRCPESYPALLACFRVLLFMSYLVLSASNPIQPLLLDRVGVAVFWQTVVASVWLFARVAVFFIFERWHGWHGRWWTPWTGLAGTIVGFGLLVGSPAFAGTDLDALALPGVVLGFALMGAGAAMIYCGALYYALSVGADEVDAGGKHEAFIGMGYALGPGIGLLALSIAGAGAPDPAGTTVDTESFRFWVILLTACAACGLGLLGWKVARNTRSSNH